MLALGHHPYLLLQWAELGSAKTLMDKAIQCGGLPTKQWAGGEGVGVGVHAEPAGSDESRLQPGQSRYQAHTQQQF